MAVRRITNASKCLDFVRSSSVCTYILPGREKSKQTSVKILRWRAETRKTSGDESKSVRTRYCVHACVCEWVCARAPSRMRLPPPPPTFLILRISLHADAEAHTHVVCQSPLARVLVFPSVLRHVRQATPPASEMRVLMGATCRHWVPGRAVALGGAWVGSKFGSVAF